MVTRTVSLGASSLLRLKVSSEDSVSAVKDVNPSVAVAYLILETVCPISEALDP